MKKINHEKKFMRKFKILINEVKKIMKKCIQKF